MVTERALLDVKAGEEADFEAAFGTTVFGIWHVTVQASPERGYGL